MILWDRFHNVFFLKYTRYTGSRIIERLIQIFEMNIYAKKNIYETKPHLLLKPPELKTLSGNNIHYIFSYFRG